MTAPSTPTVLVVGASGDLGTRIVRELRTTGARTGVMLRGGDAHDAAPRLTGLGAEVVAGDLADVDSLPAAVEGVDVLVSAVQGGPDVIVEGQTALAKAGKAAGARRNFTSDLSVDFTGIPAEQHLFLGWRKQGQEAIEEIGLPQTNTYNGAFMRMLLPQDMLTLIDWEAGTVPYWGLADQKYDFTTMDDVARYVAAAAVDENPPDGAFRITGRSLSPRELAEAAGRRTGKAFAPTSNGSVEDLVAELGRRQAAEPQNPMGWAGLQYLRAMSSGVGAMHTLDNHRYPGVVPTGLDAFLADAHL